MQPLLFCWLFPREKGRFLPLISLFSSIFLSSILFFQFHFSFSRFCASDKRGGLTSWALETCCLPPDPPKSLLPYWTVICPNSMLFPTNKEAESMWGKRVRSPVKATSLLRQLSSKKTASKERKKVSESSKLLHEKQFKWMQFIIMFCSCIQFCPLNLCQSLSQGSLLELYDVECFCCSSNTQW